MSRTTSAFDGVVGRSNRSLISLLPVELIQDILGRLSAADLVSAQRACPECCSAYESSYMLRKAVESSYWITDPGFQQLLRGGSLRRLNRRLSLEHALTGYRGDNVFSQTATFDFAALGDFGNTDASSGFVYSLSACDKYLLVARGRELYIYEFRNLSIQYLIQMRLPATILRMGMDSSRKNFLLAVVMANGAVVRTAFALKTDHAESPDQLNSWMSDRTAETEDSTQEDSLMFDDVTLRSNRRSGVDCPDINNPNFRERNEVIQLWPEMLQNLNFYVGRDSPVSVFWRCHAKLLPDRSMSPTIGQSVVVSYRWRTVGFADAHGAELFWWDEATGEELSKPFRSREDCDCLAFVPLRKGVDLPNLLRVYSTAMHPRQQVPQLSRAGAPIVSLPYYKESIRYKYLKAVPLSDGHHLLYVDSLKLELCLGCEWEGRHMATKVRFERPGRNCMPRLYRAAQELSGGVRIAVVYENGSKPLLVAYTVPPDVLIASTFDGYARLVRADSDLVRDSIIGVERPKSIGMTDWPMKFRGNIIGVVDGVLDMAVFTEPTITIWAFLLTGQAIAWQVENPDGKEHAAVGQAADGKRRAI